MRIGFSTGSLALGDVRQGLRMAAKVPTNVIELSALREGELQPLVEMIDELDVSNYTYVSIHAPSHLDSLSEWQVVDLLQTFVHRNWPVVVHPDVIQDFAAWKSLGECLCLENMDKRKPNGRTVGDLEEYFELLPSARFCFDIGHARQVDPTMLEARRMLEAFRDRLCQVHVSFVNSSSKHERLNLESVLAFRRVAHLIPSETPLILESPLVEEMLEHEIHTAKSIFEDTGELFVQSVPMCQK